MTRATARSRRRRFVLAGFVAMALASGVVGCEALLSEEKTLVSADEDGAAPPDSGSDGARPSAGGDGAPDVVEASTDATIDVDASFPLDAADEPDGNATDAPDTADAGEVSCGITSCGGTVDTCTDEANCGGCGRRCSVADEHLCLRGTCVDRTLASWPAHEHASPQPIGDGGVLLDQATNLLWQRAPQKVDAGDATEGELACQAIDPATKTWHLPTRIELLSIVEYDRSGTKVNPAYLTPVDRPYITSSQFHDTQSYMLVVDLASGVATGPSGISDFYALCTQRTEGLSARPLIVDGGPTAYDPIEHLLWQQLDPDASTSQGKTPPCASVVLEGSVGRLPTLHELSTLAYERGDASFAPGLVGPSGPSVGFWSSTLGASTFGPCAVTGGQFFMGPGGMQCLTDPGNDFYYARCVRSTP